VNVQKLWQFVASGLQLSWYCSELHLQDGSLGVHLITFTADAYAGPVVPVRSTATSPNASAHAYGASS
jgi:hypothetical protein